ncbi:hypothetical protein LXA43DRAFT_1101184 [Ganoderma leucocontextum]|nr:hypothetical protein LXA43DRAFT_1101184 [Ganoderma leucocontextum]
MSISSDADPECSLQPPPTPLLDASPSAGSIAHTWCISQAPDMERLSLSLSAVLPSSHTHAHAYSSSLHHSALDQCMSSRSSLSTKIMSPAAAQQSSAHGHQHGMPELFDLLIAGQESEKVTLYAM